MDITYIPKRGKFAGKIHTPHKNKDGFYVVSRDRFKKNHIYLDMLCDVEEYVLVRGYKVRVSYLGENSNLIKKSSLTFTP